MPAISAGPSTNAVSVLDMSERPTRSHALKRKDALKEGMAGVFVRCCAVTVGPTTKTATVQDSIMSERLNGSTLDNSKSRDGHDLRQT